MFTLIFSCVSVTLLVGASALGVMLSIANANE